MKDCCKVLGFLFVLITFTRRADSETQWATKDAEEEEEEDLNIVAGSESFRSTAAPTESMLLENSSTTSTMPPIDEDDLTWFSDSNLSDHEVLLKMETSKESSLENGIEKDSDDEVPSSLLVESRNSDVLSKLISVNPSPSMSDFHLPSFMLNSRYFEGEVSSTSLSSCDVEDEKCDLFKPALTLDASARRILKYSDIQQSMSTPTVSYGSSTIPLWNVVKQLGSQGYQASLEMQHISETSSPEFSFSTAQSSSTAQTSENVILVERTSDGKQETLTPSNHSAKGEKTKQVKSSLVDAPHDRSLRTFAKVEFTSFHVPEPEKDSVTTSTTYSTSENVKLLSASVSALTPSSEEEYVLEVSDKIVTPTVEYVYYVNGTDSPDKAITPTIEYVNYLNVTDASNKITRSKIEYYTNEAHASDKTKTETFFPNSNTAASSVPTSTVSTQVEGTLRYTTPRLFPSFTTTSTIEATVKESPSTSVNEKDLLTPTMLTTLESTHVPSTKDPGKSPATVTDEQQAPPPKLLNPGCSRLPVCVEAILLETTWDKFCQQTREFQEFLSRFVSHYTRPVRPHQMVLDAVPCSPPHSARPSRVSLAFYVADDSGEYEERLTELCGLILSKWAPTAFRNAILEVRLFAKEEEAARAPAHPILPEVNSGFVAAVIISSVAGVTLCLLCVLLVVMKQKLLQSRNPQATPSPADAYSLESLSINASFRRRRVRRSARSYLNHAFDDQEIPSHPLNEKNLTSCLKDKEFLEDEFKRIPMNMAKLEQIPEGADIKNRYSNILPKPETRVILADPSGDPVKCYINANYVKGYEGKAAYYIACQAPLPEGMEDFWRMVWEQQSRVVVMLTMFEENGVSRCAQYFPQSTLVTLPPFGDFQVSLLKKDVYEFYTMSTLRLLDLEKNLFREVTHLWYTNWPAVGVQKDPSSLVTFLLQCRPFINCNSGPTVVHCSTGTGRTGVFLALDICMREYEDSRSVDILQCITQLRRDRGGAVQNKDQYVLIYEAMLEYATRIANQSQRPSIRSNH